MHLRLTPSQMLDRWRLHSAYSAPLSDAVFVRNDGIDTAAVHRAELNRWYRRLLLEAPEEYLVPIDCKGAVSLPTAAIEGATVIPLPGDIVRILCVRLASWRRPARIVTSPTHILALRQRHPFTRATPSAPVAIFHGGELYLYPAATPSDSITTLRCVSYSEDEYCLDDSAFGSLHLPEKGLSAEYR